MKKIKFNNSIFDLIIKCIPLGYCSLFFIFFVIFLTSIGFVIKININIFYVIISFVLSIALMRVVERVDVKKTLYMSLIFLLMIVAFLFLLSFVFEIGYDEAGYHKYAIGLLRYGWNPVYENAIECSNRLFGIEETKYLYVPFIWIDCYCKGEWMFAANIYKLVNNIESGRIIQILAIISSFFISFEYFIEKKIKLLYSFMLSVLISLNPISLVQISAYYNDGLLFSMFFVLLVGLIRLVDNNCIDNFKSWMIIITSMVVLSSIKFTGLLYGGVFCIVYYIYYFYNNKCFNNRIKSFLKFVFIAVLSIVIVGMSTYVKNFIKYGSPVYPLMGYNKTDITTAHMPRGFVGKTPIYKFLYSMFSRMSQVNKIDPLDLPILKIPFSVHFDELKQVAVDTRISGFGLFFSGIFLISLMIITIYCLCSKNKYFLKNIVIINCLIVFCFILFNKDGWWARYTPYVYILPLLSMYILIVNCVKCNKLHILLKICLALFLINNLFFSMRQGIVINKSINTYNKLLYLEDYKINVATTTNSFCGNIFDLIDYDIDFNIVDELSKVDGEVYNLQYEIH